MVSFSVSFLGLFSFHSFSSLFICLFLSSQLVLTSTHGRNQCEQNTARLEGFADWSLALPTIFFLSVSFAGLLMRLSHQNTLTQRV